MTPDPERQLLRHTVAAVAYRAGKALRGVPPSFGDFRIADDARTSGQVLAHMGDLFDWALSLAEGKQRWRNATPLPWDREVERFFAALAAFDAYLASDAPLHAPAGKLFQGPIADSLTHVGQIATRRRLAGIPVRGENYFVADIATGRVGLEQSAPRREFD